MAERYKPTPHAYDPWAERFKAESRKHTKDPFPHGRKGAAMRETRRKERALTGVPKKGRWKYVPG